MAHAILDLLPHAKRTHIVCEDFRIRRVGHQKFNAGNTLRFLGALEYGIKQIDQFSFSLVPPSDHWERENRELYGRVIFNYRKLWPKPHDAAWNHCMSAWRALGHGLMALEQPQLLRLHHAKKSHRTARWLPVSEHQQDHVAPAAWWMK
jgi:hypothetical protein